jgi:hypothetical protein
MAARSKGGGGSTGIGNGLGRPAWAHFGLADGLLCPVLVPEYCTVFPDLHVGHCRQFLLACELRVPQDSAVLWLGSHRPSVLFRRHTATSLPCARQRTHDGRLLHRVAGRLGGFAVRIY